jgi:hypothetical protein
MTNNTGNTGNSNGGNSTFVGKLRMKAMGDRAMLEASDTTEAFIRGTLLPGWLVRHPKVGIPLLFGAGVGTVAITCVIVAIIHVIFAPPGSRPFAFNQPTTWIPSLADNYFREPVGNFIGAVGRAWDDDESSTGESEYDAEEF